MKTAFNWLLCPLVFVQVLLTGCSDNQSGNPPGNGTKPAGTRASQTKAITPAQRHKIDGQVFIVTAARENIKMGLAEVTVYGAGDVDRFLQKRLPELDRDLDALSSEIKALDLKYADAVALVGGWTNLLYWGYPTNQPSTNRAPAEVKAWQSDPEKEQAIMARLGVSSNVLSSMRKMPELELNAEFERVKAQIFIANYLELIAKLSAKKTMKEMGFSLEEILRKASLAQAFPKLLSELLKQGKPETRKILSDLANDEKLLVHLEELRAAESKFLKVHGAIQDQRRAFDEAFRQKADLIQASRQTLEAKVRPIKAGESLFSGFSAMPASSTLTDADGKFSLNLPAGDFIVVSACSRMVGGSTETSRWGVKFNSEQQTDLLLLSNHNEMASEHPKSVLKHWPGRYLTNSLPSSAASPNSSGVPSK